jgi:hypothetical protein
LLVVVIKIEDDVSQFCLVFIGKGSLHAQLRDCFLAVRVQIDASSDGLLRNGGQKE